MNAQSVAFSNRAFGPVARAWLGPFSLLLLAIATRTHAYARGALWALVMVVAFDGWGRGVAWCLRRERGGSDVRPVDLGLRLAWGFGVTLFLGGIACMLHIATRPFLMVQVLLGCLLPALLVPMTQGSHPLHWRGVRAFFSKPLILFLALTLVFVAGEFVLGLGTLWSNLSDDEPLYYFLPEKILRTGTPYDPYDVRRLTSYGGQFYLHAQYLVFGTHRQLNVVDAGIGTLLVFLQLACEGLRADRGRRKLASVVAPALALVVLVTIDSVRFNIGSLMTALAAILGAHRTWAWVRAGWFDRAEASLQPRTFLSDYFLVGMCAVAACVLRTSCAVPVTAFLGLSMMFASFRLSPNRRIFHAARHLTLFGLCFATSLVAWLALYKQSSGTFIYPLSHGNMTPGFAILKVEPGFDYNLKHVKEDFLFSKPITTSLAFLLGGLLPMSFVRSGRAYRPSMANDARLLTVVVVLSMVFTSILGGAFSPESNARYYFAFLMWAILVTTLGMWRGPAPRLRDVGPRALAVVAAVSIHAVSMWDPLHARATWMKDALRLAYKTPDGDPLNELPVTLAYREAQRSLPEGAAAVVTVADPFRFDLRRNAIFSLDLPGGLGEAPGFPCFRGPEVLADYLLAHHVQYIITVEYGRWRPLELYNMRSWRSHLTAYHTYLIYEAPFVVDAMESIEALQHSRKIAFRNSELTVIDLKARAY